MALLRGSKMIKGILIFIVTFVFAPGMVGWIISFPKEVMPFWVTLIFISCYMIFLIAGATLKYLYG